MNKERREELLEVADALEDAVSILSDIRSEEQEAFDSMPYGLQESATGLAMQDALDTLDEFEDSIITIQTRIEQYAKPKKSSKKK